MDALDRFDISPEKAWIGTAVTAVVGVIVASIAFTERVYHGFIWQYFWGPVHADADGVSCYVRFPGEGRTVPGNEAEHGCARDAYDAAFVAEPGYTIISTVVYILILMFVLAGVYLLLENFDLTPYPHFLYALVPLMLFGGALRTVEDAFVAAMRDNVTPALEFPASAALISPFIYFTVFIIGLSALVVSKWLDYRDMTDTWTYPLAGIGMFWLSATVGYLLYLSVTTEYTSFYPTVIMLVLALATVAALATHYGSERWKPEINAGTGLIGLVVVWGHAVDGFANVLANDWTHVWDVGLGYDPKHPFNDFVMTATSTIQGGDEILGVYVGEAWPFAIIKMIVPLAIVAVFDRQFMEESPKFAIVLLGAIIAVGLGPGTRDMLRFAFGI